MSRVQSSRTKSSDGVEDQIDGFVPDEGLWIAVVVLDEVADGLFEFFGRAMDTAAQLFFRQCREPSFYEVDPRGRSRCEVQVEALPLGQPVTNQLGLMGSVVIQNQVHV